MTVEVGQEAPDFEMRSTKGETVRLSDLRGKTNVLLVFYPFAFSGVCTKEFCGLRDENPDFVTDERVEVFGVSVDHAFTLRAWKAAENYPNDFLSDFWPHGKVASAYGVFNEAVGASGRGTFLIDKAGIIRWMERAEWAEARDQMGWRAALEEIS